MHSFPKVSCNQPFQDYTRNIPWRHSSSEIAAFKSGNTGFPIIDAAIKQMLSEGWMHNRLRMIVAMFFTKNMLQKFIPELLDTPIKNIHQPTQALFIKLDYPKPILDLKESRQRAILAFKETRDAQAL